MVLVQRYISIVEMAHGAAYSGHYMYRGGLSMQEGSLYSRTGIVSTLKGRQNIGTHYQRYLLSKVLLMILHKV